MMTAARYRPTITSRWSDLCSGKHCGLPHRPTHWLIIAACLATTTAAQAVPITVGTNAPLEMDAGTTAGVMTVNIVNEQPMTDLLSDRLIGWQVELVIRRDLGSAGSVSFASATLPASNYVFDGLATLGVAIHTMTADTLLVEDGEQAINLNAPVGVSVPENPGLNLLDLSFTASGSAAGTFGVFLERPFPYSVWTDLNPDRNNRDRVWGNFESTSEPVRIGEVRVMAVEFAVPEPVSAALSILGLGVLGATLRRRGGVNEANYC
jgi:hypothetical protein